jgi:hypothetical protein
VNPSFSCEAITVAGLDFDSVIDGQGFDGVVKSIRWNGIRVR